MARHTRKRCVGALTTLGNRAGCLKLSRSGSEIDFAADHLLFQFHRNMDLDPVAYLLLINFSSVLVPGFFRAGLAYCCCSPGLSLVGLVRAEFLRGRNFEYIMAAARTRRVERHHHIPPSIAQCHWSRP